MISILLSWLYMGFLTTLYGLGTVSRLGRLTGSNGGAGIPLAAITLTGLAEVSVLTGYLSLWMPIGLTANLIVLILGLGLAYLDRVALRLELASVGERLQKVGPLTLGMLGVLAVVLSLTSVGKPWIAQQFFNFDSGLYHVPSIYWIEQYGTVSGLGNLFAPLSVDSLWFQPYALFSFAWFVKYPLHAVLGFTVLLAFCFALGGVRELCTGGRNASDLFRVLALVPLLELAGNPASPTTDEPAAIFTLVVLALGCRYVEQAEKGIETRPLQAVIAVLALFAVAIKLSVLPLLLVVAVLAWQQFRVEGPRALGGYALLVLGMLMPKFIRSTILSGYPVYPLADLDPFNFDWKMPREILVWEKRSIESWAKMQFRSPEEVSNGGFWFWFPDWLENFKATPIALCLLVALGVFLFSGLFAFKQQRATLRRYWPIYLTTVAGVTYWFVAAPFLRFGYGFLAALAILLVLPTVTWVVTVPLARMQSSRLDAVAAALVTGLLLLSEGEAVKLGTGITFTRHYLETIEQLQTGYLPRRYLLYQADYPKVAAEAFPMRNFQLYRPATGQQCWKAPLPCTPYLHKQVEQRGDSLKDGFRARPDAPGTLGPFDGQRFNQAK